MKFLGLEFTMSPPRSYLLGRRYHHGLYGVWRVVSGIVLIASDWHDRRCWLHDFLRHPAWDRSP